MTKRVGKWGLLEREDGDRRLGFGWRCGDELTSLWKGQDGSSFLEVGECEFP